MDFHNFLKKSLTITHNFQRIRVSRQYQTGTHEMFVNLFDNRAKITCAKISQRFPLLVFLLIARKNFMMFLIWLKMP